MKTLNLFLTCVLFSFVTLLNAQTNISGIINSYYEVVTISAGCGTCSAACSETFTLASTAGLSAGDKVVVIQMQAGASGTINSGSTFQLDPTYGDVTNNGNAGNYEFATINTVSLSDVTFTRPLVNTYEVSGKVQLVRVPVDGTGFNTTGAVTGQAWNGSTGGVLALETSGSITMNHNFTMTGLGFRGGITTNRDAACCNTSAIDASVRFGYYWDETSSGGGGGCSLSKQYNYGNDKGEGIFPLITGQRVGRGHFANAGGGGCGHNSGGGGGGNCGAGGKGGYEFESCSQEVSDDMGGLGGQSIANGTAIYMGGGGGSGNGNDDGATNGGNGGGIIIIRANTINVTSGGLSISSNGVKPGAALSDGAGGGGAGGDILLEVNSFTGSALVINANGGDGGDNNSVGTCHGTGGGGGAGCISTSLAHPIGGVSLIANGGVPGDHPLDAPCGNWGALAGGNCMPKSGLGIIENTCSLPINLLSFTAAINNNDVTLNWVTGTEKNASHFVIEKSNDGKQFYPIGSISAQGYSSKNVAYTFLDSDVFFANSSYLYYRLKQIDLNGQTTYYGPVSVKSNTLHKFSISPNPISEGSLLTLSVSKNIQLIVIYNMLGQEVFRTLPNMGVANITINSQWAKGTYIVHCYYKNGQLREKLIVE